MSGLFLSDFTKKTLMQFGWKDGDEIPDAVGEFLLAAKDRAAPTTRTDVLIDVEKMLPEDVAAVQKMFADYKATKKEREEEAKFQEQIKSVDPALAASLIQMREAAKAISANKAAKEQEASPSAPLGPEIVDDREQVAATESAQKNEPAAPAGAEPQPEPYSPPPPPPIVLPFCPRCGWDMRMKYDVEVTEEDKQSFIAILLGNARFKKKYEFLGGKFVVTLRSLLADENIAIHQQLVVDHKAGELPSENEWFLRMFEYRIACSLDSVYEGDGKPVAVLPPLGDLKHTPPADNPLETGLVYLRKYVNTQVLAHEVTRRLVGQQFRRFQRLIEALEAMAVEPSFWDGIG